jgi:hypothetical protein
LKVDWNHRHRSLQSDKGDQWVSVLVQYVARDLADYDEVYDWDALDQDGFSGDHRAFFVKEPDLNSGRLRKGQKVRGWITFEFPKGVRQLTLQYRDGLFGDQHEWVVKKGR